MANNCCFDMKIVGELDKITEFVKALSHEEPYKAYCPGRVFSFYSDISCPEDDPRPGSKLVSVYGMGDCAWSVYSAMMSTSGYTRTLETETERLGLCVEIFSSEPGNCFQEHYIIDKGKVIEDECVDYTEHFVDMSDEEGIKNLLNDLEITREELFANINENGDYTTGGFENYGEFSDLFSYFPLEHEKASLDAQINKARKVSGTYIVDVLLTNKRAIANISVEYTEIPPKNQFKEKEPER